MIISLFIFFFKYGSLTLHFFIKDHKNLISINKKYYDKKISYKVISNVAPSNAGLLFLDLEEFLRRSAVSKYMEKRQYKGQVQF